MRPSSGNDLGRVESGWVRKCKAASFAFQWH